MLPFFFRQSANPKRLTTARIAIVAWEDEALAGFTIVVAAHGDYCSVGVGGVGIPEWVLDGMRLSGLCWMGSMPLITPDADEERAVDETYAFLRRERFGNGVGPRFALCLRH